MSVKDVRDALLTVTEAVYHYKADPNHKNKYIVWGETGTSAVFSADDEVENIVLGGELYYYTDTEYDPMFDRICTALDEYGISWALNGIGYGDALGQIVYSMEWGVVCGKGAIYQ